MSTSDAPDTEHWREFALEHVMFCRDFIASVGLHIDLWQAFKEFLADAGTSGYWRSEVESVFDYAWWCVTESGDEQLVAAVETFFYEDLVEYDNLKVLVPLFIAPWQFERLEKPFRYVLYDGARFEAFRSRYDDEVRDAYLGQAIEVTPTAGQHREGEHDPPLSFLVHALDAFADEPASLECSLGDWLRASANPQRQVRCRAVEVIQGSSATGRRLRRSKRVARRVAELLEDDSEGIRALAAAALRRVRSADAVRGLEALIRSDSRAIVRGEAARAVARQGGLRAVEILRTAVAAETEPYALACYAMALGETGDAGAVQDLLVLDGHADWTVRWGAAYGLDQLRHPAAPGLVDELANDPEVAEGYRTHILRWRRRLARRAARERRAQSQ